MKENKIEKWDKDVFNERMGAMGESLASALVPSTWIYR